LVEDAASDRVETALVLLAHERPGCWPAPAPQEAGHAVTIWWMVFNPDGPLSVQYTTGHVIDDSGVAEFGGHLNVGDTEGVINGGPGLLDAQGANVVLVMRDHGPADPGRVDEQIHTIGACNPTCTDRQMSMHTAG
jgi:hypothetical protein